MAITPTVTKVSVSKRQDDLYNITLNMTCTSGATIVFAQNFTQEYRTGDTISTLATAFQADMQAAIDIYNQEQVYYNHAQMDSMVSWLNSNLSG